MFYYPLFLYQPVFSGTLQRASGLNLFLGSSQIPLWRFYPSFLTSPQHHHVANFVWLGFLLGILVIYYWPFLQTLRLKFSHPAKNLLLWIGFLVLFIFYCLYPHVHLMNKNKFTGKTIGFYNNSKNFRYLKERKGFRIKGGQNYDIYIDRKFRVKESVSLSFTHLDQVDLVLRNGTKLLYQSAGQKTDSLAIEINSLKTLKVGDHLVSHIGFETRSASKNNYLWLEIH